jgi:hypothetical protein
MPTGLDRSVAASRSRDRESITTHRRGHLLDVSGPAPAARVATSGARICAGATDAATTNADAAATGAGAADPIVELPAAAARPVQDHATA